MAPALAIGCAATARAAAVAAAAAAPVAAAALAAAGGSGGGGAGGSGGGGGGGAGGSGGAGGGGAQDFPSTSVFYQDISARRSTANRSPSWARCRPRAGAAACASTSRSPCCTPTPASRRVRSRRPSQQIDCDTAPIPVPPGGHTEGVQRLRLLRGGDCHLLVYQGTRLYELYQSDITGGMATGGTFTGNCLVVWDLTQRLLGQPVDGGRRLLARRRLQRRRRRRRADGAAHLEDRRGHGRRRQPRHALHALEQPHPRRRLRAPGDAPRRPVGRRHDAALRRAPAPQGVVRRVDAAERRRRAWWRARSRSTACSSPTAATCTSRPPTTSPTSSRRRR